MTNSRDTWLYSEEPVLLDSLYRQSIIKHRHASDEEKQSLRIAFVYLAAVLGLITPSLKETFKVSTS